MDELDLFRSFRRGVATPSADAQRRAFARLASALEEATGREAAHVHHGRRRRLIVLAAAVLAVVVVTASAFGTVRDLFGDGKHPGERNNFAIEGKRGTFSVRILSAGEGTGADWADLATGA